MNTTQANWTYNQFIIRENSRTDNQIRENSEIFWKHIFDTIKVSEKDLKLEDEKSKTQTYQERWTEKIWTPPLD